MKTISRGIVLAFAVFSMSCASQPADGGAIADLLRIQALQRRAHLEKDVDLLTSIFADDFISVSNGVISRPNREESRIRFQAYFESVELMAWDDITPPVIRVSPDGSLGYALVHKRVRLREVSTNRESETEFAWVETYERKQGRWQLTMVVSTRKSTSGI